MNGMNDSNEISEVNETFITIIDHVWMVMWKVFESRREKKNYIGNRKFCV